MICFKSLPLTTLTTLFPKKAGIAAIERVMEIAGKAVRGGKETASTAAYTGRGEHGARLRSLCGCFVLDAAERHCPRRFRHLQKTECRPLPRAHVCMRARVYARIASDVS